METKIEWTATRLPDGTVLPGYTFNPVWGCSKISPACTNCYAATWARRYGVGWGPKAERRTFGEKHWNEPLKWNRQAEKAGIRRKVFCASMADVFEDHAAWETERPKLWQLIAATPWLDWLLLTKRPENIMGMVPLAWRDGFPEHVWAGTTAENQEWADKRIPHLLRVPASVRFLSMEPLLGPVNLRALSGCTDPNCWNGCMPAGISWVITGGESGPGARPSHPNWFRSLRDQCAATSAARKRIGESGVAYFHKQNGMFADGYHSREQGARQNLVMWPDGKTNEDFPSLVAARDGQVCLALMKDKHAAGRLLDGREHNGMPGGATS